MAAIGPYGDHMGLQEELIEALDADRVVTGDDERRRHGTDEGWHAPAEPDLVVYPRSTEEAAAVVRICAAHGTPIVPFGAGTSLEGHIAALDGGVSVDMTLMNAITRLSVADMDVTVQAGVTRRALDEKLRPEGVFFSVSRAPTRRWAGWPPPAPPGRPASATARCARTSFLSPS